MADDYEHAELKNITILTILRALSDPIRLEIVQKLYEMGEANCTTLLGDRPKSSMSHHFHILRKSGILYTRTQGVHHYNRLRLDALNAYFPGLMEAILQGKSSMPHQDSQEKE